MIERNPSIEKNEQERVCVCGHDIWEHEDYDFDIHECNHSGCDCKQFRDADENKPVIDRRVDGR